MVQYDGGFRIILCGLGKCMLTLTVCSTFHDDMKMHILLTVLQTFLMELVRRICLNIKTSYPW